MKISDKELRECAKGGHMCRSDNRQRFAVELLAARAAIRRLRKALHYYYDIEGHYSDCTCGTCSAITTRRGKK